MDDPVVELNVGGIIYAARLSTVRKEPGKLADMFSNGVDSIPKDSKGKIFIDRDGVLFRYVLDYLRNQNIVLPENFHEKSRLKAEAEYFQLEGLLRSLDTESRQAGYITVGYRGTFAFGRDGLSDVKFRKLARITVCGRVALCREVFGDSLNESRDPDRGPMDRYTGRFFLKHLFLEQAFDNLQDAGFKCVASCGSGTSGGSAELKPGMDPEESRWNHYNEFVFMRE
ncbi:BTB/POZ domain-containing protein KCTD12 [Folsomia candida]|uniref:BTB/POZ domain-containing protein KCTD12 n=1 Tax=Folsomia candida TaxID=158441 RepID=UPI000B9095CC|nr:BTB/POZ domain-containing protein KCTD12 [Folsomia candida]XP_035708709.1 BTB/POZ domain-containing protein KCTD12 [Folsomia candida]